MYGRVTDHMIGDDVNFTLEKVFSTSPVTRGPDSNAGTTLTVETKVNKRFCLFSRDNVALL